MKVDILSLGIGNTASVANMFSKIGVDSTLVSRPSESKDPDWLVLPGVGSFDHGVQRLRESGWYDHLRDIPPDSHTGVMGICLGMQLLCDGSEEGSAEGLGLIPGYFRDFRKMAVPGLKIPHMGWNDVRFWSERAPWTSGVPADSRFYFVHTYRYTHRTDEFEIGTTEYGTQFASVIQRGRVVGFQFHPEKSHRYGKTILQAVTKQQ